MLDQKNKIPTIAIVGAGYSGISLAANLYRLSQSSVHIYLIGSSKLFGRGVAYSTINPLHLLNVRAKDMSAFNHDPDHFVNWLKTNSHHKKLGIKADELPDQFLPRQIYGQYLQDILKAMIKPSEAGGIIEKFHAECISVIENDKGVLLSLSDGKTLNPDRLVLAHGNLLPRLKLQSDNTIPIIHNPWDYESYSAISKKDRILIIGTGLTMIDAVIQLKSQNHQGKIMALSRHGLFPQVNLPETTHYDFDKRLFPLPLKKLIRLIRYEIQTHPNQIDYHQALFKAIRHRVNDLWMSFTLFEKKQFLRHLATYWETVRHRVAPEIAGNIKEYQDAESLEIMAGHVVEIANKSVVITTRHTRQRLTLNIDCIINCTGPGKYNHDHLNPIVDSLISQGYAQFNELQLGLNVAKSGAIINTAGQESKKIFALGPVRKGISFETTAVREIRSQSEELASFLLSTKKIL